MTWSRNTKIVVGTATVLAVVAATFVGIRWWTGPEKTTVVAYFANANGIFPGDEVRILGVKVGSIDAIEPQPNEVKITLSFDADYPVPADARAAILSPALVSARAVQLVPAYTGGPKLNDGDSIPLARTAVPVEWDELRQQLQKLSASLQPTTPGGPNSVGELVNTAAANLQGEGQNVRETVIALAQAISALGDHSVDIFSTVRNLQYLVSGLRSSSELLADFNTNLADLTSAVSTTPDDVANATRGLDMAVTDLRGFIADNRESLGVTVDRLGSITTALDDRKADIEQLLHTAPTAVADFDNIYQPAQGAVTGALNLVNLSDPVQFICSAIQAASRQGFEQSAKLCMQYLAPIVKNRSYNFPPLGLNPFAGVAARPNEITYSEDRLRPGAGPAPDAPAAADPPPQATPTDPHLGLSAMMLPGPTP